MAEKKSNPFSGIFEEGDSTTEGFGENDQPSPAPVSKPVKSSKPRLVKDGPTSISIDEPVTLSDEESNHKVQFVTTSYWDSYSPVPYTSYQYLTNRVDNLEMAINALRGLLALSILIGGAAFLKANKISKAKKGGGDHEENIYEETADD